MSRFRPNASRPLGAGRLALAALAVAACGEDSVHVRMEIPAGFEDKVESVTLDVLVPPVMTPFDCEMLAFGEVSEETVNNSRTRQFVSRGGSQIALDGIPRDDAKLFFARGFDDNGNNVVAACAELGNVGGDVNITLVGRPVARVTVDAVQAGTEIPREVGVIALDFNGDPVVDAPVKWMLLGPNSETRPGSTTTDAEGQATVMPGDVRLPGPAAIDVRVRWAENGVDTTVGFKQPRAMLNGGLPGAQAGDGIRTPTDLLYQVGRIGPRGEKGFMALGPQPSAGMVREVQIAYYAGDGEFLKPKAIVPASQVVSLGKYRGPTQEHVVIITADKWFQVNPDTTIDESPGPGNSARRVVSIGPCTGSGQDLLLASLLPDQEGEPDELAVFTTEGQRTTSPVEVSRPDGRLLASGCVSDGSGVYRTVVFGAPGNEQPVVADMDVVRQGTVEALAAGIGFAPAVGGEGPFLLATKVDIEGISLGRYGLVSSGATEITPNAPPESFDPVPTLVRSTGGGDVDGDGRLDVLALLDFGTNEEGLTLFRVLFSLGVPHGNGRLVGLSELQQGSEPRLFVLDFDDDGHDDVLIATQTGYKILDMGPAD